MSQGSVHTPRFESDPGPALSLSPLSSILSNKGKSPEYPDTLHESYKLIYMSLSEIII